MTSKKTLMRLTAPIAVAALVLSACGDDDDNGNDNGNGNGDTTEEPGGGEGTDEPGGGEEPAGEAGGSFTIYNCEPQNLSVGASSEVCGSAVLEQLYSGLTSVNYETSEPEPLVAESWETEDQITWTFHLRDDFTFHNGDPVTAQTFVDTWNWIVTPENQQGNSGFHDKFAGFTEVVDGEATEMSGVRAIDEYTLEIELTEPFSPLPIMLSYTGFYPLPDVAFDDIAAFQNAPIGNGRYQMEGEWENNVQIAMTRYEDWPGDNPGLADEIVWRIYEDVNVAYNDVVAGNLDVLSGVPPEQLVPAASEFGDRFLEFESSSFTYLGFPLYQDDFADADVRHALSMAIDRQEVIDAVFDGALTPATAIIPPVLAQHRDDACNYCDYDPEAANALYEAAGGPSEITVWFNSGAGHEIWTQAVANQWQQNIPSITSVEFQSLEFAQYLDLHVEEGITGPYRLGWVLSYPSPQYAMEPIYTTGADSNNAGYSNVEFDELIDEANRSEDQGEADTLYQQAEDILLEDMPVIPMWYGLTFVAHSENVSNVDVDPRTMVRVEQITVND